jgi:hypothetical protein
MLALVSTSLNTTTTITALAALCCSQLKLSGVRQFCIHYHRRTGRGAEGGQLPPKKITKSKSRANVQHKSGEEWEIKKPKSPQFVGQTKAVGQYSLHGRGILAYYKKNWDKLCPFCG